VLLVGMYVYIVSLSSQYKISTICYVFNLFLVHTCNCAFVCNPLNVYKKIPFLCCAGCFFLHYRYHKYPHTTHSHNTLHTDDRITGIVVIVAFLFNLFCSLDIRRRPFAHKARVKRQAHWRPFSSHGGLAKKWVHHAFYWSLLFNRLPYYTGLF